jgi:thioesterase domain-containing protein
MPFERARRYFETARANHHMRFEPGSCAFPVTQIRAEERSDRISALPDLGWRSSVTGPFEVAWSPGMHETMLNPPQVARLAELVREALGEARYRTATS